MRSLAANHRPVADDDNEFGSNQVDDVPGPSARSHHTNVLSAVYNMILGIRKLDASADRRWWTTFTTITYGWPMPHHDPARETAWLDGLRGLAAFLVMSYHLNLNWFFPVFLEEPWGANLAKHGWDLWRMPFLRLFMCSGHTQVSIFFVLSGLVLSWSPLSSIRSGNYDKLYRGLGSSAFRRWIRLYFPTVPIAFWECIELYIGMREIGSKERQPTFFLQVWDFLKSCEQYANPFDINRTGWSSLHPYDWTMWTIPFEFAGSMLVFMILLCVGRIQDYARRTLVISLFVAYCALKAEWSFWLFSNGILIADYVRHYGGFKALSDRQTPQSLLLWSTVFIFALWLGGTPVPSPNVYTRPGYDFLDALTPSWWLEVEGGGRLWWNISGILIVLAASHLSTVRRFFEHSALRYLGRISYMLYLTHRVVLEPALRGFRDWLLPRFGRDSYIDLPEDNSSSHHWFITIALYCCLWIVIGPAAIFAAHWCERLFDAPSVRFARWIDDRFISGWNLYIDSRRAVVNPQPLTLPSYTDAHLNTRGHTAAPTNPYRDEELSPIAKAAARRD